MLFIEMSNGENVVAQKNQKALKRQITESISLTRVMFTIDSYRSGRVHAITRSPLITISMNKSMIGKIEDKTECNVQNSRLPVQFLATEKDTIGMITITAKHKSVMFRDINKSRVTGSMFFIRLKTTMLITLMKMVKNATIVKIVARIHANHTGTESSVLGAVKFFIVTELIWVIGTALQTIILCNR